MTLRTWSMAIVVWSGGVAAGQAPSAAVETSPPRCDAAVPRDRQIELALSAPPAAVAKTGE